MNQKTFRTSELAKAVGIHPNTVRRYIEWGLIPPVERAPNGYRIFTRRHLDCLRLARKVYTSYYPGRALRASADDMIQAAVADDWPGALDLACQHLANVGKRDRKCRIHRKNTRSLGGKVRKTQNPLRWRR